ncbi:hypothetical protein AVEN_214620-1 [Araneus ventricosus]|uniref:Uncharacterized protein n=1 Tax=Araneus ventricosus TaxID=182803 RepID=A0A4Y2GPA3_ARAVE|nr:hypothetical protein AVEN_214620-1 [Araneus ventricosus]
MQREGCNVDCLKFSPDLYLSTSGITGCVDGVQKFAPDTSLGPPLLSSHNFSSELLVSAMSLSRHRQWSQRGRRLPSTDRQTSLLRSEKWRYSA